MRLGARASPLCAPAPTPARGRLPVTEGEDLRGGVAYPAVAGTLIRRRDV
jgi:hypothetical protein